MKNCKILAISGIAQVVEKVRYRCVKLEADDGSVYWKNLPEKQIISLGYPLPKRTVFNHAEHYPFGNSEQYLAGRVTPKSFKGKSIE